MAHYVDYRPANKSFDCADVRAGASVIFFKLAGRKSAPERRGPAATLDIDETGVAVGRYCAHRRIDPNDVGDVEWNPTCGNDGTEV